MEECISMRSRSSPARKFRTKKILLNWRGSNVLRLQENPMTRESPETADTERRLAAIMFTDIVGYTMMTQADEEHAFELLKRHNLMLRPFFPKFNGREIKSIGDSFLVQFNNALDATKCGIEIQRQLHEYNLTCENDWKIKLRIGVHLGDVIESKGDVFGDTVNIASRIEPLSAPGGICISEQVFDQVSNKLSYEFKKIEQRELKNVKMTIPVYMIVLPWETEIRATPSSESESTQSSHRIAVLPFVNMSPNEEDEYFSDGTTEEIISTISKIRGIEVISRTSIMKYKKTAKSLRDIANELAVGFILEGSVRKAGDKIRVTVQMINAVSDSHVWSEKYDRKLDDIFEIQSDIAEAVAGMTKLHLLEKDKEQIAKGATRNSEAHSAYLLGMHLINRGAKDEQLEGIEILKRSISLDPTFAEAYAALSVCYSYMAGQYISNDEGFTLARKYAQKAVQLHDASSEAHVSLGLVALQYDWEWEKARKELARAIQLNPSNSNAHIWYGFYLGMMGRAAEGVVELEKAEELDPLSDVVKLNVGSLLYFAGRYDEAIAKLDEAVKLQQQNEMAHLVMGWSYLAKSMCQEAISKMIEGVRVSETTNVLGGLGNAYAVSGRTKEAHEVLEKIERQGDKAFSPLTNRAIIYVGLGEFDTALKLLEEAAKQRESWLALTFNSKIYDLIRRSPRFIRIGEQIGLPH